MSADKFPLSNFFVMKLNSSLIDKRIPGYNNVSLDSPELSLIRY